MADKLDYGKSLKCEVLCMHVVMIWVFSVHILLCKPRATKVVWFCLWSIYFGIWHIYVEQNFTDVSVFI